MPINITFANDKILSLIYNFLNDYGLRDVLEKVKHLSLDVIL